MEHHATVESRGPARTHRGVLSGNHDIPRLLVCAISFIVFNASAASAQQPAAEPPPPPPRFELTAQFGLLATTGNTSTRSLALGGEVTYRPGVWVHSGKVAFAQNEDEDTLKARSLAGRYRAERTINPRLSAYGQYAYLRDIFAGVEHRNTLEAGLSYLLIDHERHRLRVDGGLGFESELRESAEDANSAAAMSGLAYRWRISETSEFSEELRFTFPFAKGGEWKLDQVASLTVAITSLLSLRVANTIRYAHEPVPGFETTDTITSVALVMKVSRSGP